MVVDRLTDDPSCEQWRAINEIASRLGISVESMRRWYEQLLIDTGQRPGLTRSSMRKSNVSSVRMLNCVGRRRS